MIGNERVAKWVDVEKTQNREQRAGEDDPRGKGCPRAMPPAPHGDEENQDGQRKQVLPPRVLADRPPGIDERQIRRPEQLAGVERKRAACDQDTLDRAERELPAL